MDDQRREQQGNADPRTAAGPADSSDRGTGREGSPGTGRSPAPERAVEAASQPERQRDTDGDTGRAVGGVAEDELRPQGGRTAQSGADTRDTDRRPSDTDANDGSGDRPIGGDGDDSGNHSDSHSVDHAVDDAVDDSDNDTGRPPGQVDDREQQRSAEEFAQEHDPAKHDVSAGADARQPGDWTADDAGGPQVWNADGKLVEGDAPGLQSSQRADGADQSDASDGSDGSDGSGGSGGAGGSSGSGGRTSSLEEVRDGGYGVGSAATIDDGAVPMGHPVKAWEDTKTFVSPGHEQYDAAEPHLWFTDDGAAERAGFRPV